MREEDIIDIIKNLSINEYEWYLDSNKYQGHDEEVSKITTKAIQGLLDLYNKEKEKNKKLKQKIKEQQKQLNIANKKILSQKGQLKVINTSYIPKSKVREKIEQDTYTNYHTILGGRRNGKTLEYGIRLGRIQMCEELLEERN